MIDLYGVLQEQETVNGELGLGVDYYKGEQGEQGIPGKDGKDGSDQVYVGADEPTDERVKLWIDTDAIPPSKTVSWDEIENKPSLADVATSGDYNDLSNKPTIPSTTGLASEAYVNEKVAAIVIPEVPTKVSELENDKGYLTEHQSLAEYAKKSEIPAPYTLPTASTSILGGVKVDGNTITIADGVISSVGSAEPDAYIKDASVSGNTLTLTKKDNTNVVFTSSMNKQAFHYQTNVVLTDEQKAQIQKIKANPNDYDMFIDDTKIICISKRGAPVYYFGFANSAENMMVNKFIIDDIGEFVYRGLGDIITEDNWINYITVSSGSDWQYTQDQYDSNLYNAKELVVYVENTSGNKQMGYFNFGANDSNLGNNTGDNFYFDYDSSSPYISYDGSGLNYGNVNNLFYIYYKT